MLTKFTIIIPTRERAKPLYSCLKNLLKQEYQNFEILVSDNNSSDATEEVVLGFRDSRIRYINTGNRISMTHNWEFALSHVSEGWVLFIGDDDGLLTCALRMLDEMIRATGCEALTTASCAYWWPNHFAFMPEGRLTIPLPPKTAYEVKNSAVMLDKVMRGEAAYSELPWLYNGGASSVALLRRLSTSEGIYFRSRNPDVYSAISLALGTHSYAKLNVPVSINGASKFSSGTSYMLGQKNELGSPTSVMLGEANIPFHSILEIGKSVQILVYESYLQAAHLRGQSSYSLHSQLEIAQVVAPASDLKDIAKDCLLMAERNQIAAPRKFKIGFFRFINQIHRGFIKISQPRAISLSASKLGALDVNQAGDVAGRVYAFLDCLIRESPLIKFFLLSFIFCISLDRYSWRVLSKLKRSI